MKYWIRNRSPRYWTHGGANEQQYEMAENTWSNGKVETVSGEGKKLSKRWSWFWLTQWWRALGMIRRAKLVTKSMSSWACPYTRVPEDSKITTAIEVADKAVLSPEEEGEQRRDRAKRGFGGYGDSRTKSLRGKHQFQRQRFRFLLHPPPNIHPCPHPHPHFLIRNGGRESASSDALPCTYLSFIHRWVKEQV